ncbi:hypothetical protein GCM10011529_01540 [Polymorphobacter glacialis]|uniref:SPOR domain-containing protein n=1 Tax=Sandarakinorhabdus glacialis TaxID=1614636 RepID=A0A916ZIC4_9SPHN|nr:SPOR domain-containing protein [Polymorphobacter glacialis]GGD99082.1 hypothetical protein GCM10011529_01540 [Polymorphobacter glacialis]
MPKPVFTIRACAAAALLLVAACASKPKPVPPSVPAASPAGNAGRPLGLDPSLTGPERVWHLRAALNVAALGCTSKTGGAIVTRYNAMLKDRKSLLASAYQAEVTEFRRDHGDNWQPEFDRYMTALYNRFARPQAQENFCIAADSIAAEAVAVPSADFEAFATTSLVRIEQAFIAPPPVPPAPVAIAALERRTAPTATPSAAPIPTSGWRIQLGAYTGQPAATAAWDTIKSRQPGLAAYTPRYEPVPNRPGLIRVQIGGAGDKNSALTLCALASAGGFDCIAIRP